MADIFLIRNKIILTVILISFSIFCFSFSAARENIDDWYVKNFETEILINHDSSLLVTEKITADCGNLPDKHGIFRIIPTKIKTKNTSKTVKTPIELISITDFNGNPLKFSTIINFRDDTITWKIGDPNKTVTSENYYKIIYRVGNVISFDNPDSDEFHWNLLGNFWDLEIDNFIARITFPQGINQQNSKVDYYTGYLGYENKDSAVYRWTENNVLEFSSTKMLEKKQGITVFVAFPKNIVIPLSFFEEHKEYFLFFLIPLLVFLSCLFVWKKYGRDAKTKKAIMPEYEPPENLTPIELGMIFSAGKFDTRLISASVIYFAVKGLVSIKKTEKSGLFDKLSKEDFHLENLGEEDKIKNLGPAEKKLFEKIFEKGNNIKLSSLKEDFYSKIPEIEKSAVGNLISKKIFFKKGLELKKILSIFSILFFFIVSFSMIIIFVARIFPDTVSNDFYSNLSISLMISSLIILAFSLFMPKMTEKGAELLWRIKGYKLYMTTAEKYRQIFYEKENIFEKHLPYAIVFGLTKLWINKMKEIYKEDYFATYSPVWFIGMGGEHFNAESFISAMHGLSSGISSSASSGGGGAGGGGGGGGGGGW